MSKSDSFSTYDSTECDYEELTSLMEDLSLFDEPTLRFSQAFLPSLELFAFMLKRGFNPTKVGGFYVLLGILSNLVLPDNAVMRYTWLASLIVPILLMAISVLFMAHVFVSKRQAAFECAHSELWERIQDGRALRKEQYDVYLPLMDNTNKFSEEKKDTKEDSSVTGTYGIILFPGALINHTAYASLAAKLSDNGILVVVMSYNQSRLTMDVAECQQRAQLAMCEVSLELGDLGLDMSVSEWVLAGHSLGGTLALNAAANMDSIDKVILCGVGRDAMGVPSTMRSSGKQVLVINGSNDPFVNDCTDAQKETFRESLPPTCGRDKTKGTTTYVTIEGGNHAGFAHYGPQTYPKQDGERTLSIDEQQGAFVQKTLELLNKANF